MNYRVLLAQYDSSKEQRTWKMNRTEGDKSETQTELT